jgi:hypothetical protein
MNPILSAADGRAEGERRKRDAHARLEGRRRTCIIRGRRALLEQLLATGVAAIDSVRGAVLVPPGLDPKLFGPAPGPLAEAGIILSSGFGITQRAEACARAGRVWQLADRDAATARLAANPEPQLDPCEGEQLSLY